MKGDVGPAGPSSGGVTYVRWGRTTCPNTAELVYAGTVGNSQWSSNGGGSNYQCLTKEPENYENFGPGLADAAGYMYGVEYGPMYHLQPLTYYTTMFHVLSAM